MSGKFKELTVFYKSVHVGDGLWCCAFVFLGTCKRGVGTFFLSKFCAGECLLFDYIDYIKIGNTETANPREIW